MKNLFTFFCCFIFASASYAQGEANNWVFGHNAGISWNSGVPVAFSGSAMDQLEGSTCISNATGTLLFYSDGVKVWNRNHQQMPNGFGLLGNGSTTQSAVAIPWPGDTSKYYLFTQATNQGVDGFRYSVVDMNLQVGLGDVVAATKNTLLYTPSCEKISVTRHANGIDFWVATHQWNTNAFYTYLVTAAGVDTTPVISNIGAIHAGDTHVSFGYMKFSPDGQKLGVAVFYASFVEAFQFNNSTGDVMAMFLHDSNFDSIIGGPYGLEFSPNSELLYVLEGQPTGLLYQYDLQSANIIGSRFLVTDFGDYGGALQLGVDNKIYAVPGFATFLSAINSPNAVGAGCSFQDTALVLTNGTNCNFGLPNFIQSYFTYQNSFAFQNNCLGGASVFSVAKADADSTLWNFGDTASGAANISSLLNPSHVFSSEDTFTVTLHAWKDGSEANIVKQIVIQSLPPINIGTANPVFCAGDSTEVCATTGFTNYLWSNGKTDSCFQAHQAGNYYVTVTDINGCTATSNHLPIYVYPLPPVSISVNGDTLTSYNGVTYQWYLNGGAISNATENMYVTKQGGSYTVAITDTNGCSVTSNPVIVSGIHNLSPAFSVNVYPNPLEIGFWNVDCAPDLLGSQLEIYDADGRLVFESTITKSQSQIELNAARGIYMLRISSANNAVVKKLIRL